MRGLLGLVAAAVLAPSSAAAAEPTDRQLLEAVERQLKAVVAGCGPSVTTVVASRSDRYPKAAKAGPPGRLGGFDAKAFVAADPSLADLARHLDLSDPRTAVDHTFAGGVVVDAAGLVLTNYHTIDGATKLYVHLAGGGGSYADVHAADARSDLAVLKLLTPPPGLRPVKFARVEASADASPRATVYPGKLVVLLTHPAGAPFVRPGGGMGSVTGIYRKSLGAGNAARLSVYNYSPLIVHNTRPDAGCDGQALFSLDGELIGLSTTSLGAAVESGCVLPFDRNVRRIIDVLVRGEEVEYGYLGVSFDPRRGDFVEVQPNSPAALAGLSPDFRRYRITQIDGIPVTSYEDLLLLAGNALAGTKIKLTVVDSHVERRTVEVTLAKFRTDTPFIASTRPAPVFGARVDYSSILAQGPNNGPPPSQGVLVRELLPDSPAEARFKAIGDGRRCLVTHVNGAPVATPAEFYRAARDRASVELTVVDLSEPSSQARKITLP